MAWVCEAEDADMKVCIEIEFQFLPQNTENSYFVI